MVTAKVERRLAAILAADVVGYSRLMGEDEAGTLARLTAVRKELIEPLLAEHRGGVVKLMGDGALCESRAWWTPSPARSRSSAAWPGGRLTCPRRSASASGSASTSATSSSRTAISTATA